MEIGVTMVRNRSSGMRDPDGEFGERLAGLRP